MKNVLMLVTGLLITQTSFAGDAGYFSRTCVSKSQRTVLTVLNDYTEGSPIYTIVVDGVPAIYNLNDTTVGEAGDDGILTISKNQVNGFTADFSAEDGKMKLTIFNDPRVGTIAQNNATATPIVVELQCTDFWPNP